MSLELIEQEELEELCPLMVTELETFINSEDVFTENHEATIYALCQLVQNKMNAIDFDLEDKGAIVSTVIQGLMEFNEEALAAYNEMIRVIREQKASTIH